ncbi:uncharacterized protein LOC106476377, partial [Limulus polyphemus]|uniref:Uncharacterized protein LOC106476377 n=1 Tax=Limulus polyphemus TaxID=6850 RepID=A0ABM1RX67_LIMPO
KTCRTSLTLLDKYNIHTRASGSLKQHSYSLSSVQNEDLEKDVMDAFRGVYGNNFKRALVESCNSDGSKIQCNISLMFNKTESTDRLKVNYTCLSSDDDDNGYCLIPPKLVVEKESLKKVEFTVIESDNKCSLESLCSPRNDCIMKGPKFHCECKKGYSSIYIQEYSDIGTEDICV